jgi:hypothetical protein
LPPAEVFQLHVVDGDHVARTVDWMASLISGVASSRIREMTPIPHFRGGIEPDSRDAPDSRKKAQRAHRNNNNGLR